MSWWKAKWKRIAAEIVVIGALLTIVESLTGLLPGFVKKKPDLVYYILDSGSLNKERVPILLTAKDRRYSLSALMLANAGRGNAEGVKFSIEKLTDKIEFATIVRSFEEYLLKVYGTDDQFLEEKLIGKKKVLFEIDMLEQDAYCYVLIGIANPDIGKGLFLSTNVSIKYNEGGQARELKPVSNLVRGYRDSKMVNYILIIVSSMLIIFVIWRFLALREHKTGKEPTATGQGSGENKKGLGV